jgi:hypothetical protein
MTKEAVAAIIRKLASERSGHVSFRAFLNEAGITDKWLRHEEWFTGWNDLLRELNLETREFKVARTPSSRVAEAVARLIEESGRWPTEDDLVKERKKDSTFPSLGVVRRLAKTGELARIIYDLGVADNRYAKASLVAQQRNATEADAADVGLNDRVKGYVYMLRYGRRYKIGKSNDPSRRYKEVSLLLPEETHQVHAIQTDDPAGIEAYWKQRFSTKRIRNTEFFELGAGDVRAFKWRKYQ